jgi:glyoxylase-like metal-dependent hydrolase (beta-lactamase superfamily II)
MTTRIAPRPDDAAATRSPEVVTLTHPQGCRSYLVADPASGQALAIDPHLDLVDELERRVRAAGWQLGHVLDTHTHADHPSGSAALAARFGAERLAHELANHRGVARHPGDGETLALGSLEARILHAPGHTPDHLVVALGEHLFAGDTLLIGSVARTDFLGGDARQLFDTLQRLLALFPGRMVLHPGHDYQGRLQSTLAEELVTNPWLAERERETFARKLSGGAPARPANMDALLRLNRAGEPIPAARPAAELVHELASGSAASVIDVRTGAEFAAEHVAGSRLVPLHELAQRADEVRATPAPRFLLCRTGARAEDARLTLERLGLGGLTVIEGGLEALRAAGFATERGKARLSLERQVRIAAGALALLGALLGFAVHPLFHALSGFIGAGLVFAGVTDWCGMGLLLARAPWNRGPAMPAPAAGGGCAASGCAASAGSCSIDGGA